MGTYLASTTFMYSALFLGILLTLGSGQLAILAANRFGLLDRPGVEPHKQHRTATPLAGGIALMISLPVLMTILRLWSQPKIVWSLLGALIIFVFGLFDDAKALRAFPKLIGQLLAASLLIYAGVYIRIFENPNFFFGGHELPFKLLDYALTMFWVVGITNAYNLADSMDSEVAGLAGLAFAFFALGSYNSGQLSLSTLCAAVFGICISLNFYNSTPARLFLGDSGAQTLGFILAATAILYNPLDKVPTSSWFLPILLVAIPIFDTSLVFFSRLRRRQPFYKGHMDHSYHRLVALGFSSTRAVHMLHLAALLLDCLAFLAISLQPLWANGIFGLCLLLGLIAFFWLDRKPK